MRGSRFFTTAALAVCAWLAFVPAARADVQLSLRNGRVTLVARDATLRQILTEWARVGKTKIVNLERIPGGPLTIELRDVPEAQALDILLRALSGYIVAPRATYVADASVYDSISVMPSIAAPPSRLAAPPPTAAFTPPSAFPVDEDQNGGRPGVVRPPTFQPFPGQPTPQPGIANRPVLPVVRPGTVPTNPNEAPPAPPFQFPAAAPNAPAGQPAPGPVGVSAPGMISPAPAASQPGQVPQPQRPPGD